MNIIKRLFGNKNTKVEPKNEYEHYLRITLNNGTHKHEFWNTFDITVDPWSIKAFGDFKEWLLNDTSLWHEMKSQKNNYKVLIKRDSVTSVEVFVIEVTSCQ